MNIINQYLKSYHPCDEIIKIKSLVDTALQLADEEEPEMSLSLSLFILAQSKITELHKHSTSTVDFIDKYKTSDTDISLAHRIQLARKNLGLSEADLARKLNTYSDHISDWECGITEPPASMIIPLAIALQCDPLWLLTGNNSEASE